MLTAKDNLERIADASKKLGAIGDAANAKIVACNLALHEAGACGQVKFPIKTPVEGSEVTGWQIGYGKLIDAKGWGILAWTPGRDELVVLIHAPLQVRIAAVAQLDELVAEIAKKMEEIVARHGK